MPERKYTTRYFDTEVDFEILNKDVSPQNCYRDEI